MGGDLLTGLPLVRKLKPMASCGKLAWMDRPATCVTGLVAPASGPHTDRGL
jgi:hypothetical protein